MWEQGYKEDGADKPSGGLGRVRRALARFAEPAEPVLWVDSLEMDDLGMESANPSSIPSCIPSSIGPSEFSGTDASDSAGLTLSLTRDSQEPA